MIELKGVSLFQKKIPLVQDVSVTFAPGLAYALTGPAGSGKSTILKLAAGLIPPSSGTVFYKNTDIALMKRDENLTFRRESGFVFQDSALWANQNLKENLDLPLRLHFPELDAKKRLLRINKVLSLVGYKRELEIRPAELSAGEQKLIAFARALICGPRLLFLDEWTESLDELSAKRLISLTSAFKRTGGTIIFVSHDQTLIQNLAECVILIEAGRIASIQ